MIGLAYRISQAVAVALTLFCGYAAGLCWTDVLAGLGNVNGSGGGAIAFTWLTVFMSIMLWVDISR